MNDNKIPDSHTYHTDPGAIFREERTRGVTVRTLNTEALSAAALNRANDLLSPEDRETMTWTRMQPHYRWALATTRDGELVAICSEGVGYAVTEAEPFEMPLIGSWRETETGKQFSGMTANHSVTLDPTILRELAEHGEDVDLADFIRSFGDRLEANYSIWFAKLYVTEAEALARATGATSVTVRHERRSADGELTTEREERHDR